MALVARAQSETARSLNLLPLLPQDIPWALLGCTISVDFAETSAISLTKPCLIVAVVTCYFGFDDQHDFLCFLCGSGYVLL